MKNKKQDTIRLDKLLASSALGTRKEVREILRSGLLTLDGIPLTDPSRKVYPDEINRLLLNGKPFQANLTPLIMMNKASGKITAMEDGRLPTVASDLPPEWLNKGCSPVGRLDRDTTGLLLFTTDGTLNHRLCSPKYEIEKQYLVGYQGQALGSSEVREVESGMSLRDGSMCLSATLITDMDELTPAARRAGWVENDSMRVARLILTEGKFHQVKRMFEALGRDVLLLHREMVAGLSLPVTLGPGECCFLSEAEKDSVYHLVGLDPPLF